jgi:ABC-type multidrug transport system fused ATPase/permease subunit
LSPVLALLIIVVATVLAVVAMLLVRRGAPEGSVFEDGDRAAGAFGVLATGFSVLLGLIIFLAFTSYDDSRAGAEAEALAVSQQFETAQFLPADVRRELSDELVCYARSVVYEEWPALEAGTQGENLNPWAVALFRTLRTTEAQANAEQSAYDQWLDHTAERDAARRDRIHGAVGVIPGPLWFVLLLIAVVIFGFMLFFADSGERARAQAMLMGSVTAAIAAMLLLIQFLDDPYRDGLGGLDPVAMERTLLILEEEREVTGETGPLPCDADGRRLPGAEL